MNDITRRSLLLDYYGGFLTEKQREIYDLYYQQDLSLGEIADLQKVSRNAVYDILSRTSEKLEHYESILGLIAEDEKTEKYKRDLLKDWQKWQEEVQDKLTEAQKEKLVELIKRLQDGF